MGYLNSVVRSPYRVMNCEFMHTNYAATLDPSVPILSAASNAYMCIFFFFFWQIQFSTLPRALTPRSHLNRRVALRQVTTTTTTTTEGGINLQPSLA